MPTLGTRSSRPFFENTQPTHRTAIKYQQQREEATSPPAAAKAHALAAFFLPAFLFAGRWRLSWPPHGVSPAFLLCCGVMEGGTGGLAPSYSSGRTPYPPKTPHHTRSRAHLHPLRSYANYETFMTCPPTYPTQMNAAASLTIAKNHRHFPQPFFLFSATVLPVPLFSSCTPVSSSRASARPRHRRPPPTLL